MKNWKTTLMGAITAALLAVQPVIALFETGTLTALQWLQLAIAAAAGVAGYLQKDAGTTGTGM